MIESLEQKKFVLLKKSMCLYYRYINSMLKDLLVKYHKMLGSISNRDLIPIFNLKLSNKKNQR